MQWLECLMLQLYLNTLISPNNLLYDYGIRLLPAVFCLCVTFVLAFVAQILLQNPDDKVLINSCLITPTTTLRLTSYVLAITA